MTKLEELEKLYSLLQDNMAASMQAAAASAQYETGEGAGYSRSGDSSSEAVQVMAEAEIPEAVVKNPSIRERYQELFRLHSEGKSVDQIARTLNIHKGEVMLIQQLARQEEAINEA